jgi:hypothetical protein
MRSGSGRREGSRQRRGVDPQHESRRKRGWGACAALINGWDAMQMQCKREVATATTRGSNCYRSERRERKEVEWLGDGLLGKGCRYEVVTGRERAREA